MGAGAHTNASIEITLSAMSGAAWLAYRKSAGISFCDRTGLRAGSIERISVRYCSTPSLPVRVVGEDHAEPPI